MMLHIKDADQRKVRHLAEQAYPCECCGFLIGEVNRDQRSVREVRLAQNLRHDRHNRYLISPLSVSSLEKDLEKTSSEILGFFHSHPDVAALPSAYDREHAWPWYSYLIVSVHQGKAMELNCWRLKEDRSAFHPEGLAILS